MSSLPQKCALLKAVPLVDILVESAIRFSILPRDMLQFRMLCHEAVFMVSVLRHPKRNLIIGQFGEIEILINLNYSTRLISV